MSQAQVVALDSGLAMDAAKLSHNEKLSLADSIILTTARKFKATLWTQDEHFKDIKDVRYIEKRRVKNEPAS